MTERPTSRNFVTTAVAEPNRRLSPRSAWLAFGLLLVVGVLTHCLAGSYSLGIVHPDEHQQYLEACAKNSLRLQRPILGIRPRHPELSHPGILAGLLLCGEALGIRDPVQQAAFIRILMGLSVFGCFAAMSCRWMREGERSPPCF